MKLEKSKFQKKRIGNEFYIYMDFYNMLDFFSVACIQGRRRSQEGPGKCCIRFLD